MHKHAQHNHTLPTSAISTDTQKLSVSRVISFAFNPRYAPFTTITSRPAGRGRGGEERKEEERGRGGRREEG